MRKNRYFPFGYTMKNGDVVRDDTESRTVLDIFHWYLAGESFLGIAQRLTKESVPYHAHTKAWNKHMIKRILEDERYLEEPYPSLVQESLFDEVQSLISQKSQKILKKYTRTYKTEFVCGECGKALDTSCWKHSELHCQTPNCFLHGTVVTEAFLCANMDCTLLDKQLTELKIQRKAELAQLEPSEETLIQLCEQLASLRFAELMPTPSTAESWSWNDLQKAKRVIVYRNHVEII